MRSHNLAFDRASVRSFDHDGRMRVEMTNISKANVCPYMGSEIPNAEELGLDLNKTYMLLRDPEELAKAAPTFDGVPLLVKHRPDTPTSPQRSLRVGTTGSDAVFEAPYLKNSLIVWDQEGIDLIESEEQKELSCGYHYRADMTPGTYNGERYDGVMRDIRGNHVSLVNEGRAGPDVVVGDSAHREHKMNRKLSLKGAVAQGALVGYLKPRMAQDAKIDLPAMLAGVTSKTWKTAKPKLAADIKAALTGKLAKDANIDGLAQLLDMLDDQGEPEVGPGEDEDMPDDVSALDDEDGLHNEEDEEGIWRQLHAAIGKMLNKEPGATDSEDPDAEANEGKKPITGDDPMPSKATPKLDKDRKGEPPMVSKTAMDAALAAAKRETEASTIARLNAIADARAIVRPHVGELTQAFDSASAIYKYALDQAGIDLKGVDPSAYGAMVKMLPKADARSNVMAVDHAAAEKAAIDLGALGEVTVY